MVCNMSIVNPRGVPSVLLTLTQRTATCSRSDLEQVLRWESRRHRCIPDLSIGSLRLPWCCNPARFQVQEMLTGWFPRGDHEIPAILQSSCYSTKHARTGWSRASPEICSCLTLRVHELRDQLNALCTTKAFRRLPRAFQGP